MMYYGFIILEVGTTKCLIYNVILYIISSIENSNIGNIEEMMENEMLKEYMI